MQNKVKFKIYIISALLIILAVFSSNEKTQAGFYDNGSFCAACFVAANPIQISIFLLLAYMLFNYFNVAVRSREKKARELLVASEDRFRMMIENTPVGVCIIDEYGMFEYVNTAFTELYEYEQDELIGKHITLIILENLYELAMKNYNDFMKGNIPLSREWSASTKNGKKVTVLVNSAKITDLSGCQKSLLFIVDITERQKMEQELIKSREILKAARDSAESLNRQKSRFLASVSHDIRTPLNSVIGFSELIEQSELSETQREMVRCIKNSGNDLLALINDILDLSKIEAGKFEIENAPFDIKETFASAVKSISPLAGKKGLKINVSIDPGIDRLVISDSHRYKQVINNLLSNAVKFTAEGEIKAELKIVALCEMYYTIQTSVSDTGIGIPAEMHERLFTPFEQCGRATSQKYGGTGLGLTISNQIVKLIGGDSIKVESEYGRGSRFYFNLNLEKSDIKSRFGGHEVNGQSAAQTKKNSPESKAGKMTILVADDSAINIKLIETILRGEGHTVIAAENGREAIEFAAGASFDLILMDVNMPVMDGYEATKELRRMGVKAPVIAITAAAMQDEINNCRKNGMDDVLTKPILYESFIEKINEYACKKNAVNNNAYAHPGQIIKGRRPAPGKILDREFLLSNTGGRQDIAAELLTMFGSNCESELECIGTLIKSGDISMIKLAAHKIKGSALNVGAGGLSVEAAKLEKAAADKKQNDFEAIYKSLMEEYAKLKAELKKTESITQR